jgi:hypothetical protein
MTDPYFVAKVVGLLVLGVTMGIVWGRFSERLAIPELLRMLSTPPVHRRAWSGLRLSSVVSRIRRQDQKFAARGCRDGDGHILLRCGDAARLTCHFWVGTWLPKTRQQRPSRMTPRCPRE